MIRSKLPLWVPYVRYQPGFEPGTLGQYATATAQPINTPSADHGIAVIYHRTRGDTVVICKGFIRFSPNKQRTLSFVKKILIQTVSYAVVEEYTL